MPDNSAAKDMEANAIANHETLSDSVMPTHYKVSLRTLDFDCWTYSGTVAIDCKLLQPKSDITINLLDIELHRATVAFERDGARQTLTSADIDINTQDQRATIAFGQEIPTNHDITLTCEFTSRISNSVDGFYRSKYKSSRESQSASLAPHDGQGYNYMLSTHFEPVAARKAFPCFDEPLLKASFDFDIEIPAGLTAISNMPVKQVTAVTDPDRPGREVVSFETTPIMSTYLLAWAVGDFEYIEGFTKRSYNGKPLPIRVYTTPGISTQGHWGLEHAINCIDFFSETFGIDYPLQKCDFIAVHGMSFGAMENWGLVTVRPDRILFDPAKSDARFKRAIASVVAHELAHMWFGNLVTMKWWDELWLNESFATWAGHFVLNELHPEWKIWVQFITQNIETALRLDSMRNSHPVHVPVLKGADAENTMDAIAYNKGCSLLHMLTDYIGTGMFISGVKAYLKQHAYGNATSDDLWRCIGEASGKNIGAIMESWVEKIGFPVVEVVESGPNQITVKQSRFLLSGDVKPAEDETLWWIPLAIQDRNGKRDTILTEKEMVIDGVDGSFYMLNSGGTGFFRVKYPETRIATLSNQLNTLSTSDRVSLLGSIYDVALSGNSKMASVLSFMEELYVETEPIVWSRMLRLVDAVACVFDEEAGIKKALEAYCVNFACSGLKSLQKNTDNENKDKLDAIRVDLAELAALSGSQQHIDENINAFDAWLKDPDNLPSHQRAAVFVTAARHAPHKAFEALRDYWRSSTVMDGKMTSLHGISRISDEKLFKDTILPFIFDAAPVNQVAAPTEIRTVVRGPAEDSTLRYIQWEYIKDHWQDIVTKADNSSLMNTILGLALSGFTDARMVEDVDLFFKDKDTEPFKVTLERSKEGIASRAMRRKRDTDSLKEWLASANYM